MDKRRLGTSDLWVAPWCFGGNVFGWTADKATSFRLLDAFVDAGFDFIDTADVYSRWVAGHSGGESETVIGEWMAARRNRDRLVIATKVGMDMGPGRDNLGRAWITAAVEDSLRRLRTDVIDLYQAHRDDETTPQDEVLAAFADLIKAGKVRAIGASNFTAGRLESALDLSEAAGLPRFDTLQPHYNLYDREPFESDLQGLCVERQVGVIPYFSLAAGFLTGKYRSEADFGKSPRGSGMGKYLTPRGLTMLGVLDRVAAEQSATPAEVALAWVMAQPAIVAPIASATSLDQLSALVRATTLTLTPEQMSVLGATGEAVRQSEGVR